MPFSDLDALAERLTELAEVLEAQEMATVYDMSRPADYSGYAFIHLHRAAAAALRALREERDAALQRAKDAETLALFGLACRDEARRELGDLDGGWIEDTGRTMGVLTAVEVTERCTADEGACRCEEYGFPTTCVRDSEAVKAYRAARPAPPGGTG